MIFVLACLAIWMVAYYSGYDNGFLNGVKAEKSMKKFSGETTESRRAP